MKTALNRHDLRFLRRHMMAQGHDNRMRQIDKGITLLFNTPSAALKGNTQGARHTGTGRQVPVLDRVSPKPTGFWWLVIDAV